LREQGFWLVKHPIRNVPRLP